MKGLKAYLYSRPPIYRELLSLLLYFISLLATDISFRWIFKENGSNAADGYVPMLFSLCWCIALTALAAAFPRTARRIYYPVTVAFFSALTVIHACFSSFFGTYMSFSASVFAAEGAEFFDISYFNIPPMLAVSAILNLALSVLASVILPKCRYSLKRILSALLALMLGIGGIFIVKAFAFSDEGGIAWNSSKSANDIYEEFTDTYANMHICGLYEYTFRDMTVTTGIDASLKKAAQSSAIRELDAYYSSIEPDPDNEMTGLFEGKNLILIQLESIDTWMLNDIAMPNLAKIQQQSINFTEYYSPKFLWGATFSSESIVNTGMITPQNSSKLSYFTDVSYPDSLASLFSEKGYTANSFHRSKGLTYNRGEVHENWGYTKYYSGHDMELESFELDSSLMSAYELFAPEDSPFLSFIITFSGHGPYKDDDDAVKLYGETIRSLLPEDAEDEYVYALCHARETDVFIGELLKRLEGDGLAENTVIVFYTDHYNNYISDDGIITKYKGTSDKNMLSKVPFFIYSADTEPMTVTKTVGPCDILPTLVNLFDLDTDGRYYVGNDAFSQNGGYVFFPDGSWLEGDEYFDVNSSESSAASEERSGEIAKRLNASRNAVKTDYFNIKEN